jgi:regulator of ribonuclease activity A
MSFVTADLIDAHGDALESCTTQLRQFGGRKSFHGPIRTVKTYEDNTLVKDVLSQPGNGAVLVVDGGGSLRRALLGDVIAKIAVDNKWAGIVVWAAVRDVAALAGMDIGVKALGSNPRKSVKQGMGYVDVELLFGEARFTPGHWLYSDEDGIVVSRTKL